MFFFAAIENVLSNSLQQINNRLNQQLNTAMELRDQSQRYEVPHSEERIADIMVREILLNRIIIS